MLNRLKWLCIFFILMSTFGCSSVNTMVHKLDSSNWHEKTIYEKPETLPPLKIDPKLTTSELQTF
jgi:hypothetical protein